MIDESQDLIGKKFAHYASHREYIISDIYTTRNTANTIISQSYVVESFCAGQLVKGEMPLATIKRSVLKNGWKGDK